MTWSKVKWALMDLVFAVAVIVGMTTIAVMAIKDGGIGW